MTLPPQNSSFEDVLQRHGVFIYPTQGISMLPLLREGHDLAIIGARPRDEAGQILRCKNTMWRCISKGTSISCIGY